MNFNAATVSRITELTKRQIGYWDTSDLIKPSVQEAEGYGTTRLYSFIDLVQLMVAKRLRDRGVSIQTLRKALSMIKDAIQACSDVQAERDVAEKAS